MRPCTTKLSFIDQCTERLPQEIANFWTVIEPSWVTSSLLIQDWLLFFVWTSLCIIGFAYDLAALPGLCKSSEERSILT